MSHVQSDLQKAGAQVGLGTGTAPAQIQNTGTALVQGSAKLQADAATQAAETQAEQDDLTSKIKRASVEKGMAANILTSGQGLLDKPVTASRVLLGA